MLSSVLNTPRAVQMNILIIRAFIKFRELLATHKTWQTKSSNSNFNRRNTEGNSRGYPPWSGV